MELRRDSKKCFDCQEFFSNVFDSIDTILEELSRNVSIVSQCFQMFSIGILIVSE